MSARAERVDRQVAEQVERAFDYRGFVTIEKKDGSAQLGFVYDRGDDYVELFDETATQRIRIPLDEVARVELTGEDTAAKAAAIWERRKGKLESAATSAWGAWDEEKPALVVVALEHELRGVARALHARLRHDSARGRLGDASAVGVAIGMGGGAERAVREEKPRAVVSCGFSGALDPALRAGQLVLGTSVRDEAGELISCDPSLLAKARAALAGLDFVEGELLCATHVVTSVAEKRALVKPGRVAVDLESWAVARAAENAGLPWLAIRVILDPLDEALPAFTREAHADYLKPALLHALRGPRAVSELIGLGLKAQSANTALARGLERLAPVIAAMGRTAGGSGSNFVDEASEAESDEVIGDTAGAREGLS